MTYHIPVLLKETLELLNLSKEGFWVDATAGGGGYSKAILEKIIPGGKLVAIDRDSEAIKECKISLKDFEGYVIFEKDNFSNIKTILSEMNIPAIKGIIFDLGVSSHQIDSPYRGFSYGKEGPLDMRMDKDSPLSAADIVNSSPESELVEIFSRYGQEHFSKRIAAAITKNRPFKNTKELADTIIRAVPSRRAYDSLSRVFQAIRIAVNRETESLKKALPDAIEALEKGGRIAVISYHSLEDRLAKEAFRKAASDCICESGIPACICGHKRTAKIITKKPVQPSREEVGENTRARSARLRVAEKI
ncbi:MAG: 16S rRNA (cytosine(1402)-N(4))-methyltransferase RsmH [Candidatus Margulisiibacteriota bacterium]